MNTKLIIPLQPIARKLIVQFKIIHTTVTSEQWDPSDNDNVVTHILMFSVHLVIYASFSSKVDFKQT